MSLKPISRQKFAATKTPNVYAASGSSRHVFVTPWAASTQPSWSLTTIPTPILAEIWSKAISQLALILFIGEWLQATLQSSRTPLALGLALAPWNSSKDFVVTWIMVLRWQRSLHVLPHFDETKYPLQSPRIMLSSPILLCDKYAPPPPKNPNQWKHTFEWTEH